MITKNPMQLKAFIKKKAAEKNISAQLVMQNYMLERLLERISLSSYKHNFILKGGFLISAIVGLDTRATMDLDTTIKGFTLTHEVILSIFKEICAVQIDDDVKFEVAGVSDIREGDDYPGIRVALKANYPPISVTENGLQGHTLERSYALRDRVFRRRKCVRRIFSFPPTKTDFETVTKKQKNVGRSSRRWLLRPSFVHYRRENRVCKSLKQRQAALYNPIDETNNFLTTVLVIASDDNVHQAV